MARLDTEIKVTVADLPEIQRVFGLASAKITELQEALRRYGHHDASCPEASPRSIWDQGGEGFYTPGQSCACGFNRTMDKALSQ